MFQKADFQILDRAPEGAVWVRGWDLAGTDEVDAAWTAGVKMTIHRGRVILGNVVREQAKPGRVEDMLEETARLDGAGTVIDIPQDPGQAGKAQKRTLIALLQGYDVKASPESGSKIERARPLAAQAEGGNLWLVAGAWNDAFISEACLFPNGDFADQVDAASRAHARCVILGRGRKPPAGGQVIS